jgi:alpha-galactosidase
MPLLTLQEFQLGDMIARYVASDTEPGAPGLVLLPASRAGEVVTPREHLTEPHVTNLPAKWLPIRAWSVDRLVHVFVRGDVRPGAFAQCRTLRDTPGTWNLRGQFVEQDGGDTVIRTELADARGLVVQHRLIHSGNDRMVKVRTEITNAGETPLTLELLTSFSLGGITPFAADDAPGRMWVHRFRSAWSAEARPVVERVEDLQLEPSWTAYGVRCERFGAAGSMPTNGWFPSVAVEDREAGVTWAAQLGLPGSWQMEVFRRHDQLALSGGLADSEFGHWGKTLSPGESFAAPEAWLTVSDGPTESVWPRLMEGYRNIPGPASEQDCPAVFNEWCTSWGNPSHDNLIALADRLKGSGVRYLVIDDGWAERPPDAMLQSNGDWNVNRIAFPQGLRATADAIRERGLIPGVWFEFEVCNPGSKAWDETSHQLHRDGRVLEVGPRRFWDFRDPWVHEYLAQTVIALLRDNNLGYLKVDYNDSIGLGCEGAESLGEGLRQHLEGVLTFFQRIRRELPEVVIENCSSGGHREVSAFIGTTAMTSFSDAHETPAIPLIAANLIPLVPSAKSQVWAVLRKSDSRRRLIYSLAATFLGRMCLSGEVHELGEEQWETTLQAVALHRDAARVLFSNNSVRLGAWGSSYNHPTGWQAVVSAAENECCIVLHTFQSAPDFIGPIPLPPGRWKIRQCLAENPESLILSDVGLGWSAPGDFSGAVVSCCC